MQVYYKIGEIAEMYDISIRALRLYGRLGIFKPEYTDEATAYRYYTADQLKSLHIILSLKGIGFKLSEIKALFEYGLKNDELIKALEKKQEFWKSQIETAQQNIRSISRMQKSFAMKPADEDNINHPEYAHRMSGVVCLENLRIESILSEAFWL